MLPLLLGVAAATLLIGCNSREESAPARSEPPPKDPPPAPSGPAPVFLPPPLARPSASVLIAGRCRPEAPRPERFAIQDPRAELCRLHELLRGGDCRIEGSRIELSEERSPRSLFGLFPNLSERSDFGAAARDPVLRERLAALEGLQTYLYSGRPCEFDGLGDLMDLMEAYTLYRAAMDSPQAPLRRAFHEGRAGCILLRGVHRDEGLHEHRIDGIAVQHSQSHDHDAIVTPATVALESLPPATPVSDCLVLRRIP